MRQFIIKFGIVFASIILAFGFYKGITNYQAHCAEQAHEQAQAYIEEMMKICDFSKTTDDERSKLDRCQDDYEAVRKVLLNILDDRILFWKGVMDDDDEHFHKLNKIKNDAPGWTSELEQIFVKKRDEVVENYKDHKHIKEHFINAKEELTNWKKGKTNVHTT